MNENFLAIQKIIQKSPVEAIYTWQDLIPVMRYLASLTPGPLYSLTAPDSALGDNGQFCIVANGDLWYKDSGQWQLLFNMSGESGIVFEKIHLTSEEIQTGGPIVLFPSQGEGTAIYAMHDTTAAFFQGETTPISATLMQIKNAGSSTPHIEFDNTFLTGETGYPVKGDDSSGIGKDDCIIPNSDLVVMFNSENLNFDGTIDIFLFRKTLNL